MIGYVDAVILPFNTIHIMMGYAVDVDIIKGLVLMKDKHKRLKYLKDADKVGLDAKAFIRALKSKKRVDR